MLKPAKVVKVVILGLPVIAVPRDVLCTGITLWAQTRLPGLGKREVWSGSAQSCHGSSEVLARVSMTARNKNG